MLQIRACCRELELTNSFNVATSLFVYAKSHQEANSGSSSASLYLPSLEARAFPFKARAEFPNRSPLCVCVCVCMCVNWHTHHTHANLTVKLFLHHWSCRDSSRLSLKTIRWRIARSRLKLAKRARVYEWIKSSVLVSKYWNFPPKNASKSGLQTTLPVSTLRVDIYI